MANPRKFSEKIALHNKKQAEETAAFEAVLREVSATTQGALNRKVTHLQQQQHLIQPADAVCHGGSLPNVKFASNKTINLQDALNEMKQTESGRQSLFDKMHRGRQLPEQNQTRQQFDKRRDCSPYSLSYLSPPPDSSWRRAHSDSAIHSSTLADQTQQTFCLPINSSPPPNGRIPEQLSVGSFDMTAVSSVYQMLPTSCAPPNYRQINHSQSCSCDIPHQEICNNVHSSPEQDSGIPVPSTCNNTGSLPDLSGLEFSARHVSTDECGSNECHYIGPMRSGATQDSPGAKHRRMRTGPKPLFLPSSAVGHYQGGMSFPSSVMQYRGSSLSDCGTPSPSPISPSLSLHSYSPPSPGFFSDALYIQQQQQQQQQQQNCLLQQQFEQISVGREGSRDLLHGASLYPAIQPHSLPTVYHSSTSSQSKSGCYCSDLLTQSQQAQYRTQASAQQQVPYRVQVSSPTPQTVYQTQTSSTRQHSPYNTQTVSPFHLTMSGGTMSLSDGYTQLVPVVCNSSSTFCETNTSMSTSPCCYQSYNIDNPVVTSEPSIQFNVPATTSTNNMSTARIPDIVLTGADELLYGNNHHAIEPTCRDQFITTPSLFDPIDDLLCLDDALGVGLNPLELDELQMLTDANVLTDPATEDTFRFDQL